MQSAGDQGANQRQLLTQDHQSQPVEESSHVGEQPHQHGKLKHSENQTVRSHPHNSTTHLFIITGYNSRRYSHKLFTNATDPPMCVCERESDLERVDQVLDQEQPTQLLDAGVDVQQSLLSIFTNLLLGQGDVHLQIGPARKQWNTARKQLVQSHNPLPPPSSSRV